MTISNPLNEINFMKNWLSSSNSNSTLTNNSIQTRSKRSTTNFENDIGTSKKKSKKGIFTLQSYSNTLYLTYIN